MSNELEYVDEWRPRTIARIAFGAELLWAVVPKSKAKALPKRELFEMAYEYYMENRDDYLARPENQDVLLGTKWKDGWLSQSWLHGRWTDCKLLICDGKTRGIIQAGRNGVYGSTNASAIAKDTALNANRFKQAGKTLTRLHEQYNRTNPRINAPSVQTQLLFPLN